MADPLDTDLAHEETVEADFAPDLEVEALLELEQEVLAELEPEVVVEALAGEDQGLPGPPGPEGAQGDRGYPGRDGAPGGALARRTAAALAGGRVVVFESVEDVRAADGTRAEDGERLLGVVMQGASGPGEDVEVVALGLVREAGWAFTPGLPVFCGPHGELVHELPDAMAFWARVGVAVEPTAVFVRLEPPVYP